MGFLGALAVYCFLSNVIDVSNYKEIEDNIMPISIHLNLVKLYILITMPTLMFLSQIKLMSSRQNILTSLRQIDLKKQDFMYSVIIIIRLSLAFLVLNHHFAIMRDFDNSIWVDIVIMSILLITSLFVAGVINLLLTKFFIWKENKNQTWTILI
jgi:hypothetical protein